MDVVLTTLKGCGSALGYVDEELHIIYIRVIVIILMTIMIKQKQ